MSFPGSGADVRATHRNRPVSMRWQHGQRRQGHRVRARLDRGAGLERRGTGRAAGRDPGGVRAAGLGARPGRGGRPQCPDDEQAGTQERPGVVPLRRGGRDRRREARPAEPLDRRLREPARGGTTARLQHRRSRPRARPLHPAGRTRRQRDRLRGAVGAADHRAADEGSPRREEGPGRQDRTAGDASCRGGKAHPTPSRSREDVRRDRRSPEPRCRPHRARRQAVVPGDRPSRRPAVATPDWQNLFARLF